MLDSDLAELYGVQTMRINEAVTRNMDRFPPDFMFRLEKEEWENLISQSAISSWGGRRKPPRAFTEEGVAMLSSVLRSQRAVRVNVEIMRAFVRLRRMASEHSELVARLEALEAKYDGQFAQVFQAIRQLMAPLPPGAKRDYGFVGKTGAARKRAPHSRTPGPQTKSKTDDAKK